MDSYASSSGQELDDTINRYNTNINKDAGYYWWKRYTYSAFWSISATPINLFITIFTALTTAQSTTGSLIGTTVSSILGITTLILSVVNTFFKPYTQLTENQNLKEKWADIGIEFENIFFSTSHDDSEKRSKLMKLAKHYDKVCALKKTDDNNYLIDIIFLCSKICCIRKDIKWLPDASDAYKNERIRRETLNNTLVNILPSHGVINESVI